MVLHQFLPVDVIEYELEIWDPNWVATDMQ